MKYRSDHSHLHVHHIRIGLYDPIAYLQSRLEGNVRLDAREHGFLKAGRRFFQLEILGKAAGLLLQVAGGLQCLQHGILETRARRHDRFAQCFANTGEGADDVD